MTTPRTMNHPPLTGLVAAPYTPMRADGGVHLEPIEQQAQSLVANGVGGAFVCGTTGEGLSLAVDERQRVAERWRDVTRGGGLRLIVHVGHTALAECKALAAHAQQIGAAAVGCLAPCFFKPASADDLVAFCAEVAAAAPGLPFYYYHIPSMTGVDFPVADVLAAADGRIPNLAGAKFTHENLMDFGRCLRLRDGRFDVVFGRDEMLLSALALGARGAIGSTYNYAAPVYRRLIAAYDAGDLPAARAEQARATEMIAVLARHGFAAAGKAVMKMIGIDCGPSRLPLRTLTDQQYRDLDRDLRQTGFFDFCSERV